VRDALPPDCISISSKCEITPPLPADNYLDMVDTDWGDYVLDEKTYGHEWTLRAWSDCWGTDQDCEEGVYHSVNHLQVDYTTVVNFRGMRGYLPYVYLHVRDIDFSYDSILIINIESDLGDFSLSASSNVEKAVRHIAVRYHGELRKSYWKYDRGSYYLDTTRIYDPWPGLPEPSTYGAAFSFSALAVGFIRRRKKRKARLFTPVGVPV